MVHQINNGTSSTKYALCDTTCGSYKHTEIHPLFYGEKYKETTCMSSFSTPKIKLTKPFEIHSTELIIQRVCNVYNKVA